MPGYNTPNNTNQTNYPGTSTPVTHSYDERLTKIAEFDDALLDQATWRNSRYDGSKMTSKEINKFTPIHPDFALSTPTTSSGELIGKYTIASSSQTLRWGGDNTYSALPVVNRLITALYISNTVVGGEENDNYVTLKNHSYVGISQIILINLVDDSVQVLDAATTPYNVFHRFITTDFPTGNTAICKVIEDVNESTPNNLSGLHRVRMNKGYLLKTFTYKHAGEVSGSAAEIAAGNHGDVLTSHNTMFLYKGAVTGEGSGTTNIISNLYITGSETDESSYLSSSMNNQLRFRYANLLLFEAAVAGSGDEAQKFNMKRFGPKFDSSSIHENKFTRQYYSGSYGLVGNLGNHSMSFTDESNPSPNRILSASSLGHASRFIAINTLGFLASNNADTSLTEQEKTEVHVTFFQGTKDFAPGKHDERSIGTFEVDQNRAVLDIAEGDICNAGLPTTHEFVFKGPNDNRFIPRTTNHTENLQSAHLQNLSASGLSGCLNITHSLNISGDGSKLQSGLTLDSITNMRYYVQGGALGPNGRAGIANTGSGAYSQTNLSLNRFGPQNSYSGSFHYEISFLDKSHTLILNLDKDLELPDGIGNKGLVIVPQDAHSQVAFNVDFYLNKAGIVNTGVETLQNTTGLDTNPNISQNTDPADLTDT